MAHDPDRLLSVTLFRPTFLALLGVLTLSACDDETAPPPPISYIEVRAEDSRSVLAPGDTLLMETEIVDVRGESATRSLEWSSSDPTVATVGEDGTVVALATGTARISAREPDGVQGFRELTVQRISRHTPQTSAFGGVVTLHGSDLGPATTVRFGEVPGRVASASEDGRSLEVWVPWTADDGPIRVRTFDGVDVQTPEPFFLTGGGDDALEPNSFEVSTPLSIPYRNPFLRTRIVSLDHFLLETDRDLPLTVRVIDRELLNSANLRSQVQINRADEERGEFLGVAPVYAVGRDEPQPGVISRPILPAGRYRVRIFVWPGNTVIDRNYELVLDTVTSFERTPDAYEPNDFPEEAPRVELPFSGTFELENPWTVDYYSFEVTERSRVSVTASLSTGNAGVFLFDGDRSVTWHFSNRQRPTTFRGFFAPFGSFAFSCVVEPGIYHVGVIENSGNSGPYSLSVDTQPNEVSRLDCLSGLLRDAGKGLRTDLERASPIFHATGAPRPR